MDGSDVRVSPGGPSWTSKARFGHFLVRLTVASSSAVMPSAPTGLLEGGLGSSTVRSGHFPIRACSACSASVQLRTPLGAFIGIVGSSSGHSYGRMRGRTEGTDEGLRSHGWPSGPRKALYQPARI